jgi:hypothetical protein
MDPVCPFDSGDHDWEISAWNITQQGRHATEVVCLKCFQTMNQQEARDYRDALLP